MEKQKSEGGNSWVGILWGVLVLFLMLIFLAYFGALNQEPNLPEWCRFPVQLQCGDFKVNGSHSSTDVSFALANGVGQDLTIIDGVITANPDTLVDKCKIRLHPGGEYVINTEKVQINFSNCLAPTGFGFDKKKYTIVVSYKMFGSNLTHSIQGEILAKRENQ